MNTIVGHVQNLKVIKDNIETFNFFENIVAEDTYI